MERYLTPKNGWLLVGGVEMGRSDASTDMLGRNDKVMRVDCAWSIVESMFVWVLLSAIGWTPAAWET